jgi:hypothetical protein
MLDTLIKLGQQLSDGRGEWDDIIDFPNIIKEREKSILLLTATNKLNLINGRNNHNLIS